MNEDNLQKLLFSTHETLRSIESLIDEIDIHDIKRLKGQIENVLLMVDSLNRKISGDGINSIETRTILLEREIKLLAEKNEEMKKQLIVSFNEQQNEINEFLKERKEIKKENFLNIWKLIIVSVPGIISLVIALIEAFFTP